MRILFLILLLAHNSLGCWRYPESDDECPGNGFISPTHLTALYSSRDSGNSITMSWHLDMSKCSSPNRYGSALILYATNYFEKIQAGNQNFVTKNFDSIEEGKYSWAVFNECWRRSWTNKRAKRSLANRNFEPDTSRPDGYFITTGECWMIDKNSRQESDKCYRDFYYCKRQPASILESPISNSFFKAVSTILFRWSAVTYREPVCGSQITELKYIFSLWRVDGSGSLVLVQNQTISTNSFTLDTNLITAGTYRWSVMNYRVVPQNKVVPGSSSLSATPYATQLQFVYCEADLPPTNPVLISPINNILIKQTPVNDGLTVSISLSWSIASFGRTCSQASSTFVLYFSQSPTFASGITSVTLIGSQTTFSRNLPNGIWYWGIQASNGVLSANSTVGSFSICVLRQPNSFNNLAPSNGAQGIIFTSVTFQWESTTKQTDCATNTIHYLLYVFKLNESPILRYNGTNTNTNIVLTSGTYSWYVIAIDSEGQSVTSPTFNFVTVDSVCSDISPAPTQLNLPSYSWNGKSIQATVTWDKPSLGVVCNNSTSPAYSRIIVTNQQNNVVTQADLDISTLSYILELSAGSYTWKLEVYNSGGAKSTSEAQTIVFCETGPLQGFANNFSPNDNSVYIDDSLTHISWSFTVPSDYTCLGGSISYNLAIQGESSIFHPITNTSVQSYDLQQIQPGTWTWTLSNDLSEIPISGLSSLSYTRTFHKCYPGVPLPPSTLSPTAFSRIVGESVNLTMLHDKSLQDSCSFLLDSGHLSEKYVYELFVSTSSSYSNVAPSCSTELPKNSTMSTFSCPLYNMNPGLSYWKSRVTKVVLIGNQVVHSSIKESSNSLFSICINTPPITPKLIFPENGTVYDRCNISTKFTWEPLQDPDYGIYCSGTNSPSLKIFIGKDPVNPSDFTLEAVSFGSQSDSISFLNDFLPNTTYYWYILASGTLMSTRSEIRYFITPNTSIPACSGNGKCSLDASCQCEEGFFGIFCENVVPTQPPEPTDPSPTTSSEKQEDDQTGVAIGISVALILLLLIGLFAFFIVRKRIKSAGKEKERPIPDIQRLAFNPPEGYPSLDANKIVPWYSFEQLLLSNNFLLAKALMDSSQATEIDDVAKCLVYVIESRSKGSSFVKELITKDLKEKKEANTLNSTTLFRDNSHASKAFKYYSKIVGLGYLYLSLGDYLYTFVQSKLDEIEASEQTHANQSRTLTKRKSSISSQVELTDVVIRKGSSLRSQSGIFNQGSLEVDPSKMGEDDDILVNSLMLQMQAQKILICIFRSSHIFPPTISDIFRHLFSEVEKNLSTEDSYSSIAGFTFLRLINPSILFPHQYALYHTQIREDSITRELILLAKVLQNLANGVHFGGKEEHMTPMNDFIDSNKKSLRNFLQELLQREPAPAPQLIEPETKTKTPSKLNLSLTKEETSSNNNNNNHSGVSHKKLTEEQMLSPLEVPRNVVEQSLCYLYNQLIRTKDKCYTYVERTSTPEEAKFTITKFNSIISEIGDPIQRDLSLRDKK